jgi:hypothetical protein
MVSDSERKKILEMIEDGTITPEEGLNLLKVLGDSDPFDLIEEFKRDVSESDDFSGEAVATMIGSTRLDASPTETQSIMMDVLPEDTDQFDFEADERFDSGVEVLTDEPGPPGEDEINKWKRFWVIPLWIGTGITVIGGALMYWAFQASGFGFWFACAWFPFLLGVAVLALAWGSRTSPWLHVRVHQAPGERPQKIAISFPIPIRLTVWGLRTFGHHIPQMGDVSLDDVILALKDVAKDGTPFFVDVDEGDNGERVQVFIG